MSLRHIILDLLYEHIDGFSFQAIYNCWRNYVPEVDLFSVAMSQRLEHLLQLMVERGELERPRYAWYRLSTSKWLAMTEQQQSSSTTLPAKATS